MPWTSLDGWRVRHTGRHRPPHRLGGAGIHPGGRSHRREGGRPPTPEAWEEELAKKGDTLGYTPEGGLGLYAGDRLLSAVPGCGEGVSDHQLLSGRDAGGQHPISSITGWPTR